MENWIEIISTEEESGGGGDSILSEIRTIHQRVCSAMAQYLNTECEEHRRLADLRQQGWSNPAGDTFFQNQRQTADTPNPKMGQIFYQLMRRIGQELHLSTNAFAIGTSSGKPAKILDMCMAPGGFLETALSKCPKSTALAFSLPVMDGGHAVLLPRYLERRVTTQYSDITMFAKHMGMETKTIPENHPDAASFICGRQIERNCFFDLVICDGQVLRTHSRLSSRESREAIRLSTAQLAIGLEHLRVGGTMIILLHRADAYQTANLIFTFSKISTVRLFKSKLGHVKRSSFYMVASSVQSQDPMAKQAIQTWKKKWRVVTFESDEKYLNLCRNELEGVHVLLEEFGKDLVQMGKDIWQTQADALAKAPFIKKQRRASTTKD